MIVNRNISFEPVSPEAWMSIGKTRFFLSLQRLLSREALLQATEKIVSEMVSGMDVVRAEAGRSSFFSSALTEPSGCCWNRFGNVLAFEEINKPSREDRTRAKEWVQSKGFVVIKGNSDNLFVKKEDATKCVTKGGANRRLLPCCKEQCPTVC